MADSRIPQREPRSNIPIVMRATGVPRTDVDRATLRRILAEPLDAGLSEELEAAEAPVDDPWPTV